MPSYFWDPAALKYGTIAEEFLSQGLIIGLIEDYMDDVVNVIDRITQDLVDGEITLAQWQTAVARRVKDGYVNLATMGRGGRDQMSPVEWGRVGGRLRFQYNRLDNFAFEIASGDLSPAQIQFRARMYGRAIRSSYFDGLHSAAENFGYAEMRRVLQPADHCQDCIGYADRGWQSIGSLPVPGQDSRCLTNCKCRVEYRGRRETESEKVVRVLEGLDRPRRSPRSYRSMVFNSRMGPRKYVSIDPP